MEVVKRLKIEPIRLVVEEHRYHTYACRTCDQEDIKTPVIKAPREKNIIPGSFATPEAIAHIMTQKFVMGSPLYRQEQELRRQGNLFEPADHVQLDPAGSGGLSDPSV